MDIQEKTPPGEGLFSPRTISFIIMALAIGAVFYLNSKPDIKESDINKLERQSFSFIARMMLYQTVYSVNVTGEGKYIQDMDKQLQSFQDSLKFFDGQERGLQYFILRSYLYDNQRRNEPAPESSKTSEQSPDKITAPLPGELDLSKTEDKRLELLKREFKELYVRGRPLRDDALLFETPVGVLARIKHLTLQKKTDEATRLEKEVNERALYWLGLITFFTIIVFLLSLGGLIVVFLFARRRPPVRFTEPLALIAPGDYRLLPETAILFLFLMFPVQVMIGYSKLIPQEFSLNFSLFYSPLILVLSLWYFQSSIQDKSILRKFVFQKESGGQKTSVAKEIAWGGLGFIAIFPIAFATLMMVMQVFGGVEQEGGIRMAHPVAFKIKEHFWTIFVLAVIIAPIVEEMIFRNFIYGYFRRNSRAPLAALFCGVLFAIVHPQGVPALPYLAVLGGGLCILREYRPGIIAPIVTHMIVNCMAITLVGLMLGW